MQRRNFTTTTHPTIPSSNTATMPKEVKQKSGIAVGMNAGHVSQPAKMLETAMEAP
jgi:hypothetical protein